MNPAPSVIVFTVLSGLGFGYLALLGFGIVQPQGGCAFLAWGLGYALSVIGLLASTFHLGRPDRAWRAFSQWRSSWLSREGCAAVATLLLLAPQALSDWLGLGWPRLFGVAGAGLALLTVLCTAMIYAQLKTVPRWNHWTTVALFLGFSLTGGSLLAAERLLAVPLGLALSVLLTISFRLGDGRFAARGHDLATATGLRHAAVFEQPHTGSNYLTRDMIFVVGRKHARRLRAIAVICAGLLPALLIGLGNGPAMVALAVALHLLGASAARWLFFAEAEHVVGLYYGRR